MYSKQFPEGKTVIYAKILTDLIREQPTEVIY